MTNQYIKTLLKNCLAFFFVLMLFVFCSSDLWSQKRSKTERKDFREWSRLSKAYIPDNFVLFMGGTILSGAITQPFRTPPEDSVTLEYVYSDLRKIKLPPFALSNAEVTNNQYRTFVNWVVDSIALTIMAESDPTFYTDTVTKRLNWSKNHLVRDTNCFERLSPLYEFVADKNHQKGGKYRLNTTRIIYRFNQGIDNPEENLTIYPDTLVWVRDDISSVYNEVMAKGYFSNPAFQNHPVVGVSWAQANAYCDWLSRSGSFRYRLPSSAEFHAAYYSPYEFRPRISSKRGEELVANNSGFPWNSWELWDNQGKYLANFGNIRDNYNFLIKGFGSDGQFYTSKIGTYPPSSSSLYDLGGNVAEWVSDILKPNYVLEPDTNPFRGKRYQTEKSTVDTSKLESIILFSTDSIKDLIEKVFIYRERNQTSSSSIHDIHNYWKEIGSPTKLPISANTKPNLDSVLYDEVVVRRSQRLVVQDWYEDEIKSVIEVAKDYQRNLRIISAKEMPRSIMGGSWQDSPLLLQAGVKQVCDANTTSSKIGFRVVADVVNNPELENFANRATKPLFPVRRPYRSKKTN